MHDTCIIASRGKHKPFHVSILNLSQYLCQNYQYIKYSHNTRINLNNYNYDSCILLKRGYSHYYDKNHSLIESSIVKDSKVTKSIPSLNASSISSSISSSNGNIYKKIEIQDQNEKNEIEYSHVLSISLLSHLIQKEVFSFELKSLMRKQLDLILSKGILTRNIYKFRYSIPPKAKEELILFILTNKKLPNLQERMILSHKYNVHPRMFVVLSKRMLKGKSIDQNLSLKIDEFLKKNQNIGISKKKLQEFKRNFHVNSFQLHFEISRRLNLPKDIKIFLNQWLYDHLYLPPDENEESKIAEKLKISQIKIRYFFMHQFRKYLSLLNNINIGNVDKVDGEVDKLNSTENIDEIEKIESLKKIDLFLNEIEFQFPKVQDVEKLSKELHIPYPQLCFILLKRRCQLMFEHHLKGDLIEAERLIKLHLDHNSVGSESRYRMILIGLKTGVLHRHVVTISYNLRHPPGDITPEKENIIDLYLLKSTDKIDYKLLAEQTKLNRYQVLLYVNSRIKGELTPEAMEILNDYAKLDKISIPLKREIVRKTKLSLKQVNSQLYKRKINLNYPGFSSEQIELIKNWGSKFNFKPSEDELIKFSKENKFHRNQISKLLYEERNRFISREKSFPLFILDKAYEIACRIGRKDALNYYKELLNFCKSNQIEMNKSISISIIRDMKRKIINEIDNLVKIWYNNNDSKQRPNSKIIEEWTIKYPGWTLEIEKNILKYKKSKVFSKDEIQTLEQEYESKNGLFYQFDIEKIANELGRTPISIESWYRKRYKKNFKKKTKQNT